MKKYEHIEKRPEEDNKVFQAIKPVAQTPFNEFCAAVVDLTSPQLTTAALFLLGERYPFLNGSTACYYPGADNGGGGWMYESIPTGWRARFGIQMCEDYRNALYDENPVKWEQNLHTYSIDQIKEKFGELRWYDNSATERGEDLNICYEALSSYVCVRCGAIKNVRFINRGWVSPICPRCHEKTLRTERGSLHYYQWVSERGDELREKYGEKDEDGKWIRPDFFKDIVKGHGVGSWSDLAILSDLAEISSTMPLIDRGENRKDFCTQNGFGEDAETVDHLALLEQNPPNPSCADHWYILDVIDIISEQQKEGKNELTELPEKILETLKNKSE